MTRGVIARRERRSKSRPFSVNSRFTHHIRCPSTMQLSLSSSLPRSKTQSKTRSKARSKPPSEPREEPSEQLPSEQSTLTATSFLGGTLPSRRANNTLDCITTPCPKCNKRSLVRRSPNTFDCLNCNFHKQLPPISNEASLITPNRIRDMERRKRALGIYNSTQSLESNSIDTPFGQGSLSRFLDTSSVQSTHTETETAQPMIFAAIAVIIGILIL